MGGWPATAEELVREQLRLAVAAPPPWVAPEGPLRAGGVFVCFPRDYEGAGAAGDPAWVGAAVMMGRRVAAHHAITGVAGGPYEPGLMALREGPLLEAAARPLAGGMDVLLVNATGRDHPRRAGLALHVGAVLEVPTIGVTHRPLLASGPWPPDEAGPWSPLAIDGEVVAAWLRTRAGRRPLVVHPGWRTDLESAIEVVRRVGGGHRTPAPLREARRLARRARAGDAGDALL